MDDFSGNTLEFIPRIFILTRTCSMYITVTKCTGITLLPCPLVLVSRHPSLHLFPGRQQESRSDPYCHIIRLKLCRPALTNTKMALEQLLTPLRESIIDKPPYISGKLQLEDSSFSLLYRLPKDSHAARFQHYWGFLDYSYSHSL